MYLVYCGLLFHIFFSQCEETIQFSSIFESFAIMSKTQINFFIILDYFVYNFQETSHMNVMLPGSGQILFLFSMGDGGGRGVNRIN
jgi:hypothetical protein